MNSANNTDMNPLIVIKNNYDSFSQTQKKIADLLLKHGDRVCFMSLKEFSSEVGVTAVTVVKFCKRLGYGNFSSLKKALQEYVQSIISSNNVLKIDSSTIKLQNIQSIFTKIMSSERRLLKRLHDMISQEKIFETVNLLKNADKIYLIASGVALAAAQLMNSRLFHLKLDSQIIDYTNAYVLPSQFSLVKPDDVFVVFSFPDYSSSIVNAAKCAKSLENTVICITDKPTSPSACYSDVVLLCDTASLVFVNSMTPVISLITIILTLLAVENQDKIMDNNNRLSLLNKFIADISEED